MDQALQFDRRAQLQVDTLLVQDLRVSFKIKKTDKKHPNTAEIRVYNLAAATRARMQTKNAAVVLSVGYRNSGVRQIFSGDARTVDHVKGGHDGNKPEWETIIRCGDGERCYQFAPYSKGWSPGSAVTSVVKDIGTALNLDLGNLSQRLGQAAQAKTFAHGFSFHGKASDALSQALGAVDLDYSIQDGSLQILGDRETNTDPVMLISPSTGMVGSPDHGTPLKKGEAPLLKVTALLLPNLRPGSRIKVESNAVNGYFRARIVEHEGDTHQGRWYTVIQATPL